MKRKDIIDTLCVFDLIHKSNLEDFGITWMYKNKIYVRDQTPDLMRRSIIHELLHAYHFLTLPGRPDKRDTEKQVYAEEERIFKELYRK